MNIQSHRFGRAAVILAAGACLAACSSKPRERAAEGSGGPNYYGAGRSTTGTDSIYPFGPGKEGYPGMGGTMLLDTNYERGSAWNRSDSTNRDSSPEFPEMYPGTGTPGNRPEGGSGKGGRRDTMDLDRINDSLGVLDWYERG